MGKNILMVDFDRKRVEDPSLRQYFKTMSDVFEETLKKDGRVVGHFYWRVGYRYRG